MRQWALVLILLSGCLQGPQVDGPVSAPTWHVGDWWSYEGEHGAWTMQKVADAGNASVFARVPGRGPPDLAAADALLAYHPASLTIPNDWDLGARGDAGWRFVAQDPSGLDLARFPLQEGQTWTHEVYRDFFFPDKHSYTIAVEGAKARDIDGKRQPTLALVGTYTWEEKDLFTDDTHERDGLRVEYVPVVGMPAYARFPAWAEWPRFGWWSPEGESGAVRLVDHGTSPVGRTAEDILGTMVRGAAGTPEQRSGDNVRKSEGDHELEIRTCASGDRWDIFESGVLVARRDADKDLGESCEGLASVLTHTFHWPGVADVVLSSMDGQGQITSAHHIQVPLRTLVFRSGACDSVRPCVLADVEVVPGDVVVALTERVQTPRLAGPAEVVATADGQEMARQEWDGTTEIHLDVQDAGRWSIYLDTPTPVEYTGSIEVVPRT